MEILSIKNSAKLILFSLFFLSCTRVPSQITVQELDNMAIFSFSVMSDNKGYALENESMYKTDKWIREAGDKFILGLGDHVKDNRTNLFLDLIKNDSLWHNHFYPAVADGENELWGKNQGDYGSGAPILKYVGLENRNNVTIGKNGCDYYAIEEHDGIKVHIIQLYYSDTPIIPDTAFTEETRKFLFNTLDKIDKGNNDIIVVLAHTNRWLDVLSQERRKKLLSKADILFEANTHSYRKINLKESDPENSAAMFNTGAVGNSRDNGFIQIHVLANPLRLIVQYLETSNSNRVLQRDGFAYQKVINGSTTPIDWNNFK